MIYSQWQPGGGYKYFETTGQHPIGDDLPDIRSRATNPIGIPSFEVGQPIPARSRFVGSGDTPIGVIAPTAKVRSSLAGGTFDVQNTDHIVLFLVGVGLLLGAGFQGMIDDKKKRRAR